MYFNRHSFLGGATAIALMVILPYPCFAAVIVPGDTADAYVEFRPATSAFQVLGTGEQNAHVGTRFISGTDRNQAVILVFQLPVNRPADSQVVSASLGFFLSQINSPTAGVDLLGLRWSNSSNVLVSDYATGPTLIQSNILTTDMAIGARQTSASGNNQLAAWLNDVYDQGAQASDYVFLQFKYAGVLPSGVNANYRVDMADNNDPNRRPVLTFDFVIIPEPGTMTLLALGGVLLSLIRYRRMVHTNSGARN